MDVEQRLAAIEASHPDLVASLVARFEEWRAITRDDDIAAWESNYFDGGRIFEAHVAALASIEEVVGRGDRRCDALFPVLWHAGDQAFKADGTTIKPSGTLIPATLVIAGDVLAFITQVADGWVPLVYERSAITGVAWVKVGGMFVSPKYLGLQFSVVEGNERWAELVCFAQLLTPGQRQAVRESIIDALAAA